MSQNNWSNLAFITLLNILINDWILGFAVFNFWIYIQNFRSSEAFPIFILFIFFEKLIFADSFWFVVILAVWRSYIKNMRVILHQILNIFDGLQTIFTENIFFLNFRLNVFFVLRILKAVSKLGFLSRRAFNFIDLLQILRLILFNFKLLQSLSTPQFSFNWFIIHSVKS